MSEAELDHRMDRYGLNPCGEILGADFHCNLSEVHLNQLDPTDFEALDDALCSGFAAGALLHHEFQWEPLLPTELNGSHRGRLVYRFL